MSGHGTYEVFPICEREVDKHMWKTAHNMHERCKEMGLYDTIEVRCHGRRLNGEVELFEDETGKVRTPPRL